MTKGTIGLICLTMFLTLTVLTGGGWAEEHLGAGITEEGKNELFKDYATNNRLEQRFDSQTISTTNDIAIKYDREKFDKIVFHEIGYYKNICFQLKGDDIERCVKTEWLYELLKMIQP